MSAIRYPPIAEAAFSSVAQAWSINPIELKGRARPQYIAEARFVVLGLLYERGLKPSRIGRMVNRARTMVKWGTVRFKELSAVDRHYKASADAARQIFKSKITP